MQRRGHRAPLAQLKYFASRRRWLLLRSVGKMAPLVTERGLKSVVWQSECGGAGAEREARRAPRRPCFPAPDRSLWGSRRGHLLRRDPRPCWDFFLLPFPSCCQHRGWAGCGRAAFCLGRAPSAFCGRLWPRAPPWVSGRHRRLLPPPGRGPSAAVPASPMPAPAADVSTRDEPVRALYSFISPPLVPALEFPKAAYSVYSC